MHDVVQQVHREQPQEQVGSGIGAHLTAAWRQQSENPDEKENDAEHQRDTLHHWTDSVSRVAN